MAEEGLWYVVHTMTMYENKVANDLQRLADNHTLGDKIQGVKVPTSIETELDKNGNPKEVERKLFPGYVFVKMVLTDDSWYLVRNTRGVTGFVGSTTEPIPLTAEEVDHLGVEGSRVRIDFKPGDSVEVVGGELEGFIGIVESIDTDNMRVKVKVSMFGRDTTADMDLAQVKLL